MYSKEQEQSVFTKAGEIYRAQDPEYKNAQLAAKAAIRSVKLNNLPPTEWTALYRATCRILGWRGGKRNATKRRAKFQVSR